MSDVIGLSAQQHYRIGEELLDDAHSGCDGPEQVAAFVGATAHFAAATAQMAIYRDAQISKVPL
jgi:hypothetical protein